MVFTGNNICSVIASFHNFMFFIYFQFIVFLFIYLFFCLAKKGGHGTLTPSPTRPLEAEDHLVRRNLEVQKGHLRDILKDFQKCL